MSVLLTGSPDNTNLLNRQPARLYGYERKMLKSYNFPVAVKRRTHPSHEGRNRPYIEGYLLYSLSSTQRRRIRQYYPTYIPSSPMMNQATPLAVNLFKRTRVEATLSDRSGFGYEVQAEVYLWHPHEEINLCAGLQLASRDWDSRRFKGKSLDAFLDTFGREKPQVKI